MKTSKQIGRSTGSTGSTFSHNSSQKKNETVDIKGKSISSHIDDGVTERLWLSSTALNTTQQQVLIFVALFAIRAEATL